ncbi:MAG: hypothetical protein NW224_05690 [Leptolyngbyaceae cyanobacterium bins.302]|nr:hypothetical protein [Leptolyngbyaceae cyanobacterium bins.302]
MATPALKSLLGAIAGATALSLVSATTTQAAVLNFAFEVKIDQGPYSGTHKGSFRFDDTKLAPCFTVPSQNCATPGDSGLSITFNFMGNTYTHESDVDYNGGREVEDPQNPTGPRVVMPPFKFASVYYYPDQEKKGLNPYLLSLLVMAPTSDVNFAILGNSFRIGFPTYGDAGNSAFDLGKITYSRLPGTQPGDPSPCQLDPDSCNPAAVPEPSEIAGSVVAVGLVGLFWRFRRRRTPLKLK